MAEFEDKLPIGKAKLEFIRDNRGGLTKRVSGTGFCAMYQIAVGYDGKALGVVPFVGIGQPLPPYPQPSMLAWILSDSQGMWGRRCPFCRSYFRTNHVSDATTCPYCGKVAHSLDFITEGQERYVVAFCNALGKAMQGPDSVTIDLESITDSSSEWNYEEERQQFHFRCTKCDTQADILGEYGSCPQCGRTNAGEIFGGKVRGLEERFDKTDKTITDQKDRGEEWEKINNDCFSLFEALGKHIQIRLSLFPAAPKRRKELENLSFQRLFNTSESLKQWLSIDILKGTSPDDQGFLKLMLHRRHIVVHNGGRVDEDYLKNSGDTTARLNQHIRIGRDKIRRLIPLIRLIATNLLEGYESIG